MRPPATYHVARWLFLRILAAVYAAAFGSLALQIDGLLGSHGILPAREFLRLVAERMGAERFVLVPTVCWLAPGDWMLHGLCWTGLVAALLLFFDVWPLAALSTAWIAYLSLQAVGQDFLSFQWDALLLETGFLALLIAPSHLRPRGRTGHEPVPRAGLLLLWFLLFKLMFSSGLVKLLSGDPVWRHFAALEVHYETQPIPNPIAWWAHQLPAWFHRAACFLMFLVELAAPWLIPLPARWRRWAFVPLAGLQVLIALTGNFAFFNLLSLALCVLVVDDATWPRWVRRSLRLKREEAASPVRPEIPDRAQASGLLGGSPRPRLRALSATGRTICVGLWVIASLQTGRTLGWRPRWPAPVRTAIDWAQSLRMSSNYGLFAVMTTTRPEIVVEGSDDGVSWQAYEFRYKPGDPRRRPPFVAPFQPRLDWQMWFAALSSFESEPWFGRFCERLLLGTPEVTRLLARNPFPDRPPRFVRAGRWDYRFTDLAARRASGAWWTRTPAGEYTPALSLRRAAP